MRGTVNLRPFTGCTLNQSKKEIASLIFICEVTETFVLLGVSIWQAVRGGKCSYDRVKYLIGVQGSSVPEVWWLICLVRRTLLCLIHTSSVSGSLTLLNSSLVSSLFTTPTVLFSFLSLLSFLCNFPPSHVLVFCQFLTHSLTSLFLSEMIIELSPVCSIYSLADKGDRICDICSYLQTRSVGCGKVSKMSNGQMSPCNKTRSIPDYYNDFLSIVSWLKSSIFCK